MSIVTVEVCANGTITRACARAINRAIGTKLSGSSTFEEVGYALSDAGVDLGTVRIVNAAALTGADKGRHTREVNRSRNAQARRIARKAEAQVAA